MGIPSVQRRWWGKISLKKWKIFFIYLKYEEIVSFVEKLRNDIKNCEKYNNFFKVYKFICDPIQIRFSKSRDFCVV